MKLLQKLSTVFLLLFLVSYAQSNTVIVQEQEFYHRLWQSKVLEDTKEVFKLVNELRAKGCTCGGQKMPPVPALNWDDALAKAAQVHSNDMRNNNNFSHTGTDGSEHWERMEAQGYNWGMTGENIAWGQSTPKEVMEGWIKSPGHCKNMMKAGFEDIGVGKSGKYWTQVFGAKM